MKQNKGTFMATGMQNGASVIGMPGIMRQIGLWIALAGMVPLASATVLLQLSLAEMAQKSTAIVRAKVTSGTGELKDKLIYTVYGLDVRETWKAGPSPIVKVAVPGGVAAGTRQVIDGAPVLKTGDEYILFLWTGRTGLTQIIGLSQGLYRMSGVDDAGNAIVTRPATKERMVNSRGQDVKNADESIKLSDLRHRVDLSIHRASDPKPVVAQGSVK
jgi:hypothetical protein